MGLRLWTGTSVVVDFSLYILLRKLKFCNFVRLIECYVIVLRTFICFNSNIVILYSFLSALY